MNNIQKGIIESITGVVFGIVLTAIISSFVKDEVLPSYALWLFGLLNLIGNITTINSFRYVGTLYTFGWLIGALLMKDIFTPIDYAFNIGGPIVILIARAYFFFKNLR